MYRVVLLCMLIALTACGGDEPRSDVVDASGSGPDADPGPPPEDARYCVLACTTPADCATSTNPGTTSSADNFTCDDGACNWLGCFSDQECRNTMQEPNYVCRMSEVHGGPACLNTCATDDDCGTRWQCMSGACHYTGCTDDSMCTDFGAGFICSLGDCLKACATMADCAGAQLTPPNAAENFVCYAGACHWIGCGPTGCDSLLGDYDYICEPPR